MSACMCSKCLYHLLYPTSIIYIYEELTLILVIQALLVQLTYSVKIIFTQWQSSTWHLLILKADKCYRLCVLARPKMSFNQLGLPISIINVSQNQPKTMIFFIVAYNVSATSITATSFNLPKVLWHYCCTKRTMTRYLALFLSLSFLQLHRNYLQSCAVQICSFPINNQPKHLS